MRINKLKIKIEQEISHEHCSSCVMCSRSLLNESSCFFVNNKIFCREDYCRTQCTQSYHKCRGNQCTRCGLTIKPGEMFQTAKFSKVREKFLNYFDRKIFSFIGTAFAALSAIRRSSLEINLCSLQVLFLSLFEVIFSLLQF
jgi:hypothetical protein